MDLTQLAILGEFIGGVAVLATLIYLAVEVTRRVLTAAVRDVNENPSPGARVGRGAY